MNDMAPRGQQRAYDNLPLGYSPEQGQLSAGVRTCCLKVDEVEDQVISDPIQVGRWATKFPALSPSSANTSTPRSLFSPPTRLA